ncbi:hypothetical protein Glove_281g27 [Diversispora epigaea]|uniref:Uncharacterized protein n=1 Tax=Diversispora epigaea TaxID=1348612 RepID=A0A397I3T7_9GLOM|nr:hypothetical protein Glove_281g27 [Diversispora epigaea]
MYEIVTAQRPFADQAHDTYLMIDISNGVRPKLFFDVNNNVMRQLEITDENHQNFKSKNYLNYFYIQSNELTTSSVNIDEEAECQS